MHDRDCDACVAAAVRDSIDDCVLSALPGARALSAEERARSVGSELRVLDVPDRRRVARIIRRGEGDGRRPESYTSGSP